MSNDWTRVQDVFDAALALPADVRRSYIARTCGDDEPVRQQVELLLDSHERAISSRELPAASSLGATGITRNLEGNRIGPYLLGARIGAGGMGEVYRARDTRLDRTVAIKVLPAHVADDPLSTRTLRTRSARCRGAESSAHLHAL